MSFFLNKGQSLETDPLRYEDLSILFLTALGRKSECACGGRKSVQCPSARFILHLWDKISRLATWCTSELSRPAVFWDPQHRVPPFTCPEEVDMCGRTAVRNSHNPDTDLLLKKRVKTDVGLRNRKHIKYIKADFFLVSSCVHWHTGNLQHAPSGTITTKIPKSTL